MAFGVEAMFLLLIGHSRLKPAGILVLMGAV